MGKKWCTGMMIRLKNVQCTGETYNLTTVLWIGIQSLDLFNNSILNTRLKIEAWKITKWWDHFIQSFAAPIFLDLFYTISFVKW